VRSPPIQGVPRHPPESAPQALPFSREGRRGGMPVPCQAPGIESSMLASLGRSEGQLGEEGEGSASGSAGSQLVRAGTEGMGGAGRCTAYTRRFWRVFRFLRGATLSDGFQESCRARRVARREGSRGGRSVGCGSRPIAAIVLAAVAHASRA
jgi:hypothetical protein